MSFSMTLVDGVVEHFGRDRFRRPGMPPGKSLHVFRLLRKMHKLIFGRFSEEIGFPVENIFRRNWNITGRCLLGRCRGKDEAYAILHIGRLLNIDVVIHRNHEGRFEKVKNLIKRDVVAVRVGFLIEDCELKWAPQRAPHQLRLLSRKRCNSSMNRSDACSS